VRRTVLLLASMLLAVLLAAASASAEVQLDQENTDTPSRSDSDFESFSADRYLAQSFTAGKTGELVKVAFWVEGYTGQNPPANLNVRIYRTYMAGAEPRIGERIASTSVPSSQLPPYWNPGWTEVTFDPGSRVRLLAGNKYALAIEPEWGQYRWARTSGFNYPYGEGYDYGATTTKVYLRYGHLDFLFRTYVDAPVVTSPPDTVAPEGEVLINDGARRTKSRWVTLTLSATDPEPASGVTEMRISNNGTTWSDWEPSQTTKEWPLGKREGKKIVYVQYRDAAGNVSASAADHITYRR
jgi:hypothetical protein